MKAAIAIGVALVVVAIVFITILVTTIKNTQNADFYTLGSERVPSIKSVVGERKIRSFDINNDDEALTKSYKYKSKTSEADLIKYEDHLVKRAGFIITKSSSDDDGYFYAKKSVDEGELILVYIEQDASIYEITVQKRRGILEINSFTKP